MIPQYRCVMNTRKVHTDDTPVKVLAPGRERQKQDASGPYVRDDRNAGSSPAVWFAYSPDRQENIRYNTFVPSGVSCKPDAFSVTIGCSVQNVKVVH
ncbi:IS66 family transposase [Escherichia coli]|nr:IS66 family transposase [Escherichia coli]MCW7326644.1 IS66 family transposase [Escherichia coli]